MGIPASDVNPTLAEQTEQAVKAFIASLPDAERETVLAAFDKLSNSDLGDNAVNVGDTAPDFTLPDVHGQAFGLHAALQQGPLVLNFYRGGWCPFCSLEFRALQQILPGISELGARLVGVSPETPDTSLSTIEKHTLRFEVLSDVGNRVARQYGLLMNVFEELRPLYLQWGLDIPQANGDDSWELPIPATYIIDTDARVRAAYVNRDYTKRMEPTDIIAALRAL